MIIGSEDISAEWPSATARVVGPPKVIQVGKIATKIIGLRNVVEMLSLPVFTQKVPGFEVARQASWDLFNELVQEGAILPNGEVTAGCKGCQGHKLLARYKNVYRLFVARCIELSKVPDGLAALKEYCQAPKILLQDPDTQQVWHL